MKCLYCNGETGSREFCNSQCRKLYLRLTAYESHQQRLERRRVYYHTHIEQERGRQRQKQQ
jgi:hypothetical protein